MNAIKFALILFCTSILVSASTAQQDRERELGARRELERLEPLAKALPAPQRPDFRTVPTPLPHAVRIASDLRAFVARYGDLERATKALRLLVDVHLATGDIPRAIQTLEELDTRPGGPLPTDRARAAALRAEYGDIPGADAIWTALIEEFPEDPRVAQWKADQAAEAKRRDRQTSEARAVKAGLAAGGAHAGSWRLVSQRFVRRYPLHPESERILTAMLLQLRDEAPAMQLPHRERLVFYFPDRKNWKDETHIIASALARDGEYEKAFHQVRRLLDRSDGATVDGVTELEAQLSAGLDRIAVRGLEVTPVTKRARYADLLRRSRQGHDPEGLRELAQGFVEDYPTCAEVDHVRFVTAEALRREQPLTALEFFRAVAARPGGSWARRAAEAAAAILEAEEGGDAAIAWLDQIAPRFADTPEAMHLALVRADVLTRLERWEDAAALLEPMAKEAEDLEVKAAAARKLAEVHRVLGK